MVSILKQKPKIREDSRINNENPIENGEDIEDSTQYNLAKQENIYRDCSINKNIFKKGKEKNADTEEHYYTCNNHNIIMCEYCKNICHKDCPATERNSLEEKECECGRKYHLKKENDLASTDIEAGATLNDTKEICPYKSEKETGALSKYYPNLFYQRKGGKKVICYFCYNKCYDLEKQKDFEPYKKGGCACLCEKKNHSTYRKEYTNGAFEDKKINEKAQIRNTVLLGIKNQLGLTKKENLGVKDIIGLKDIIEKYIDFEGQYNIMKIGFGNNETSTLFRKLLNFFSILQKINDESNKKDEINSNKLKKDITETNYLLQTNQLQFFEKILNNLIKFEIIQNFNFNIKNYFKYQTLNYLLKNDNKDDESSSNLIILFFLKFHRKCYLKSQFYPFLDSPINISPLHRLLFSKPQIITRESWVYLDPNAKNAYNESRINISKIIDSIENLIKNDNNTNLYELLKEYLKHLELYIKFNYTSITESPAENNNNNNNIEKEELKIEPYININYVIGYCIKKLESIIELDFMKMLKSTNEILKINDKIQKICEMIYLFRNDYYFLNELIENGAQNDFNIELFFIKTNDDSNIGERLLNLIFNKSKFVLDDALIETQNQNKLPKDLKLFKGKSKFLLDNLINDKDYYITSVEQIKNYNFLPKLFSYDLKKIIYGKDFKSQKYDDDTLKPNDDLANDFQEILSNLDTTEKNIYNLLKSIINQDKIDDSEFSKGEIQNSKNEKITDEFTISIVIKYYLMCFINFMNVYHTLIKAKKDRIQVLKNMAYERNKNKEEQKNDSARSEHPQDIKYLMGDKIYKKYNDQIESLAKLKNKIYKIILDLINDNPFIAALFFTNKMYKLFINEIILKINDKNDKKCDYDINFYSSLLRILKKSNYKINTFSLVEYLYEIYQYELNENDSNEYLSLQIKLLDFFKLVISVTHEKEYVQVNQKIAKIIIPFGDVVKAKSSDDIGINRLLDCLTLKSDENEILIKFLNSYLSLINKLEFNIFSLVKSQINTEKLAKLILVQSEDKDLPKNKKILAEFEEYPFMKDLNLRKNFVLFYIKSTFGSIYKWSHENLISLENRIIKPADIKVLTKTLRRFKLYQSKLFEIERKEKEKNREKDKDKEKENENENEYYEEKTVKTIFSFLKNVVGYCSYLVLWKISYYYNLSMEETFYIYKIIYLFMECCNEVFTNFIENISDELRDKYIKKYFIDNFDINTFVSDCKKIRDVSGIKTNFSNTNSQTDDKKEELPGYDSSKLLEMYKKVIKNFRFYEDLICHEDKEEKENANNITNKLDTMNEISSEDENEINKDGIERMKNLELFIENYNKLKLSYQDEDDDDEDEDEDDDEDEENKEEDKNENEEDKDDNKNEGIEENKREYNKKDSKRDNNTKRDNNKNNSKKENKKDKEKEKEKNKDKDKENKKDKAKDKENKKAKSKEKEKEKESNYEPLLTKLTNLVTNQNLEGSENNPNANANVNQNKPEKTSLIKYIFKDLKEDDKDNLLTKSLFCEIFRALKLEVLEDFELNNPFKTIYKEVNRKISPFLTEDIFKNKFKEIKEENLKYKSKEEEPKNKSKEEESNNETKEEEQKTINKLYFIDLSNYSFITSLMNLAHLVPRYYQEIILDEYEFSSRLIDVMNSYQNYYLSQLFMFTSQSIIKTSDFFFNLQITIFELLRLLCEDHNPLFQTFLIRPRTSNPEYNYSFPLSFKLSHEIAKIFVHNKKQAKIIKFFENKEKFNFLKDLENELNDFRTELIQGTTYSNLEFISNFDEFKIFENYFDYYSTTIFDEIDEDSKLIAILGSFFTQFITSYVEEICAYKLPEKSPLNTIAEKFSNKKLIGIANKCFKILFKKKDVRTEDKDEEIVKMNFDSINETEQEEMMDKFDKIIENLYKYYDIYTNSPYFQVCFSIFLFFNQLADSSLEKSGIYKGILKDMSEVETTARSGAALNITMFYYKFCSKLMMKNDIMYTLDYSKWNNNEYMQKYVKMIPKKENKKENKKQTELISSSMIATNKSKEVKFEKFDKEEEDKFSSIINEDIGSTKNSKKVNRVTIHYQRFKDSLLINEEDAQIFKDQADYSDHFKKLSGLLKYYNVLNEKVQLRKEYSDNKMKLNLSELKYENWVKFNVILCLIPNILLIFSTQGNIISKIIIIWEVLLIIWLLFMIGNYLYFQKEKILKSGTKNGEEEEEEEGDLTFWKLLLHIFDRDIMPFTWALGFGLLGMIFPFFYSFQLFIMFYISDTMSTVLKAIQDRYTQFLSTAAMLLILILFYAAVNNYFFKVASDGSDICQSYLECFLLLFNSGTRAGGLEAFGKKLSNEKGYISEFVYSWSFFFLISLIILNIINGIIVDAFQNLREEDNNTSENKKNVCFICQFKRSKFETRGINFENHCEHDHSVLNYFCYLFKIFGNNEHDLNSVDYQVYQNIKNNNISFFPIKNAKEIEK